MSDPIKPTKCGTCQHHGADGLCHFCPLPRFIDPRFGCNCHATATPDPDRIYSAGFILDFTMTAHMSDGTPVRMNYRRIGEKTYPVGRDGKIVEVESDGR